MPSVQIIVNGRVDDLYALSLLFPEGAHPGLRVVTAITGQKDGLLDRVDNADNRETYVTGEECLPLIEAHDFEEMSWIAREIIAPLNGYAVLADSNFTPVVAVGARWDRDGITGMSSFSQGGRPDRPTRLIATNSHRLKAELRESRVVYMAKNPLAAYASAVIAGPPSWADYYRVLEDIAGQRGTKLDKLASAGLAKPQALRAFRKAANNRVFGRHGASMRDTAILQESLMNLLEAREFVRGVVSTWLDLECGGRMPRDRVDGGPLRFGLDDHD